MILCPSNILNFLENHGRIPDSILGISCPYLTISLGIFNGCEGNYITFI